ncbi:MAG: DUF1737 domain-containing protein [Crocinitomicaceae bacterium]|nr:DUF1737 domain-containing protein [Crocinitomicaceae bacterium]
MSKNEYILVTDTGSQGLLRKINEKVKQGYSLCGSPSISADHGFPRRVFYAQLMVKKRSWIQRLLGTK